MILLIRKPDVLPEPGGPGINTPSCLLFLLIPILLPLYRADLEKIIFTGPFFEKHGFSNKNIRET